MADGTIELRGAFLPVTTPFDATTGECHIDPEERLERFDVEVRGSLIFVRVG